MERLGFAVADADVTIRAGVVLRQELVDELAGGVLLGLGVKASFETVGAQVVDAHANVLGEVRHAVVELLHHMAMEAGDLLRGLETVAELANKVLGN